MVEIELNTWHLLNPLNLQDLFITFPPISGTINLCDTRVVELSSSFSLVSDVRGKPEVVSEKVVVNIYSLMVLLALLKGRLFFWKMGDERWFEMEELRNYKFVDIASYGGKLYAYDSDVRKLVVIDPNNTWKMLLMVRCFRMNFVMWKIFVVST